MNVASLELCKELYKLSGWTSVELHGHYKAAQSADRLPSEEICPAYDLGYLLRKLPPSIHMQQDRRWWFVWHSVPNVYEQNDGKFITEIKPVSLQAHADTPEDAACMLAVELFKQGILITQ